MKNFIFDNGEVLFNGIKLLNVSINKHCNPPKPLVNADLYGSAIMRSYLQGKTDEDELWRAIISHFNLQATPELLMELVRQEFTAVTGTMEVVKDLRAANPGAMFGILSVHGREWVRHLDKNHAFHEHFDRHGICYSCDTGHMKPEPQAFYHVARCLGARPQECLFIDDHPANCETAQELGFMTHTFTTAANLRSHLGELDLLPRHAVTPTFE